MSYSVIDPSDSIESTEDETESLDELGMSVRDADALDEDVVVVAGVDEDADDDALDEEDDDEDDEEEEEEL